jgi:hypothetical protein
MKRHGCLVLLPAFCFACGGDDDTTRGDTYSSETLAAHRRAIPTEERLVASEPQLSQTGAQTRPGSTVLAAYGVDLARAVNRPVRALVWALRAISELDPSYYDLAERRFVWGPWAHERGVGKVALVVAENEPGADFTYSYMLVRTPGDTLDDATPVILGGATPDAADPDRGVGVALWDVEANHTFEVDNGGDTESTGRGRFVTLFGHDTAAEGEAHYNLAAFRDFVPDDAEPSQTGPIDVDYFYGRFQGSDGARVDFLDSDVLANICGASSESCFEDAAPASTGTERFEYGAYVLNHGLGRAEVRLSEGDLAAPTRFVECWDTAFQQTSFQMEASGSMVEMRQDGSCAAPTDQSAAELGLPTLDDVDAELLTVMGCAAENGLVGCP